MVTAGVGSLFSALWIAFLLLIFEAYCSTKSGYSWCKTDTAHCLVKICPLFADRAERSASIEQLTECYLSIDHLHRRIRSDTASAASVRSRPGSSFLSSLFTMSQLPPGVDLWKIPFTQPPPGVASDFSRRSNLLDLNIALITILAFFTTSICILRVWVNLRSHEFRNLDDGMLYSYLP